MPEALTVWAVGLHLLRLGKLYVVAVGRANRQFSGLVFLDCAAASPRSLRAEALGLRLSMNPWTNSDLPPAGWVVFV
jgi:hypothetical protein